MSATNDQVLNRSQPSTSTSVQVQGASPWHTAGWLFFTLLLCFHFTLCYSAIFDYLNLDVYTRGLSPTPYQYRALPMFLFRLFSRVPIVSALARHAPVQLRDPYQIMQAGIALFSILGAVFATCGTITRLTGDRIFSRWFSLLIVYMAYFNLAPGWGLSYTFPYDLPSLMFFCIGIYLIVSNRLLLYYLLFPLAVLNRETICFLTIFFVIWNVQQIRERGGTLSRRQLSPIMLHVLAQVVIWITIKAWLAHMFASNPVATFAATKGSIFTFRLFFNLKELIKPQQWAVYLSCCGFLLPALWLQRRWIRNAAISQACFVIIPLWFLGMMIVGVIPEIRIFSELSAFVVPALALIVYNRFRVATASNELEDTAATTAWKRAS
jgi:hypothetical protein